jgi:biopolymer transport protein ExbB
MWKVMLAIGVLLSLGPILGFLGTIAGMVLSYDRIESMAAPTPGDLAVGVRWSLLATILGACALPAGIAMVIWSCVMLSRSDRIKRAGSWT